MTLKRVGETDTRPSWRRSLPLCAGVVLAWGVLRLAVFHDVVMPLTYALPLLICVWSRDRRQIWGMAAIFAVMAVVKMFWILPEHALPTFQDWAVLAAQWVNIAVAGGVVHAIINLRDWLEQTNAALAASNERLAEANHGLEASNEELAAREEEIRRQNEELQSQSEELSQQNEELRSQGEELEQQAEELTNQAEELQAVNEELAQREQMLQSLLGVTGALTTEGEVLDAVCEQALRLLGPDVIAAAVVEACHDTLHLCAQVGVTIDGPTASCWPLTRSLARLVIQEGRTAALDDIALRPDLVFPQPAGGAPFRSILATPLRSEKEVIGAIEFYGSEARPWTEDQFRLAEWVAAQCASVFQAVRLRLELQASESRFRTMADAIPQLAWTTDADGWIHWYNRRWYEYTGTTAEQMEGWGWQSAHDPETLPAVLDQWQASLAMGEPFEMIFPLRGADGVFRPFLTRALPLKDEQGRIVQWLGTNTDITQQQETERRLAEAKEAAEATTQSKAQFLANMSHELRTPMNAILGMIDVALPKAADPTVKDCLQTARGSADLLLTLLNDLLDSSKIEAGKLELESVPFSLRHLLDQVARVLSIRASEKGLVFSCRTSDDVVDGLLGDRMRLQQVLLNLAGNAIKFTERGEVEVSVRTLEQNGEVHLEFTVRDTGIGIPPSALDRLFQPFSQADPSMTRRFGGTGLGLSIAKSLVELMGGRIWAESEVGKGSRFCFTVRLHVAEELPPEPETPGVAPAPTVPLKILIVEDNPGNQKLATYVLEDRGHTVEIAGDGQTAVRLAQHNHYDVILMDVQMPGLNGLEATAAIRAWEDEQGNRPSPSGADEPVRRAQPNGNSRRRIPIIAMTAHAMHGDRDRCLQAGMDGYLSKPIHVNHMISLVESLVDGHPTPAGTILTVPGVRLPDPTAVFQADEALVRCFHSNQMLQEMIQCFFEEVETLFPEMRAALARGDLAEVGRLGHRMKGTVVYLGADPAKHAALRVERFERTPGESAEAEAAIRALERECQRLKSALTEYQASTCPQ